MAGEKQFENKVKRFLKEQGVYYLKYWAGAVYTKSGIPDLLICCEGVFIAVELKAKNGKPSDLQLFNLRKIERAGGFSFLLYPDKFESFKQFIIQLVKYHDTDYKLYEKIKGW